MILINQLDNLILECDFPISNIISKYLPIIQNEFEEFWDLPNKKGYDMGIKDREVTSHIIYRISNIIESVFDVRKVQDHIPSVRVYIQTNTQYGSVLHNHSHNIGNICSIFYVNIPKNGGEILFKNSKLQGGEYILKPKKDKLYLFPIWLDHKPLPQLDELHRISFNWNYPGYTRPIVKRSGEIW